MVDGRAIYVIRHGQDEDNAVGILNGRRDRPLTSLGREQAQTVARELVHRKIEVVMTSPLRRAYETATIVASAIGVRDLVIERDLIEREFGVLTGQPAINIAQLSKNNLQSNTVLYFLDPEGVELFPDLLERGKRVLSRVQSVYPGRNTLLVAHGDIGKMIWAAHYGWAWEDALRTVYFGNAGVLELNAHTHRAD